MSTDGFEAHRAALEAVLVAQLAEADEDYAELREQAVVEGEPLQEWLDWMEAGAHTRSLLQRKLAFVRDVLADEAVQELLVGLSCAGWQRLVELQKLAASL